MKIELKPQIQLHLLKKGIPLSPSDKNTEALNHTSLLQIPQMRAELLEGNHFLLEAV
jgi:hypothetical protein